MSSQIPRHLNHPNKAARASFAKHTINTLVPHILQNNTRARLGNESTERIYYSPATVKINNKASSSKVAVSSSKHIGDPGKITGHFKPLKKKNQEDGDQGQSSYSAGGQTIIPGGQSMPDTTLDGEVNDEDDADANAKPSKTTLNSQPKISVVQADTLNAAQVFVDPNAKNRRIAVLNMASFLRPGGGVINGAIAQEESLCLRSTLYPALDEKFYRIPKFGGLFTKDILVFRDSDNKDLPKSDWYFVDVISVAALKNPDLVKTDDGKEVYEYEQDKEEMISKIKLILLTALKQKITHLILGALGCGAYHNPPEEVAKMFKRVLFGDKKGRGAMDLGGIEEIVFAIFDDGVNLRAFREVLDGAQTPAPAVIGKVPGDDASKVDRKGKDIEMRDAGDE